jgi:transmembrane sensor
MNALGSPAQQSAADIQLRAAEWVMERRETASWTSTRQAALEVWLSQSPAHLLAYWRLNAAWERTYRLAALRATPSDVREMQHRGVWRRIFLAIAPIVAIALPGIWAAGYIQVSHELVYSTAIGGHKTVFLSDGSRIELNTGTTLRVHGSGRAAELVKGEAYFQIRHDALNPFVVEVAGHRLTDLGTKFFVRDEPRKLEIALLDGSVRFDSADPTVQPHSETLRPGDVAVATDNSVSVMRKSPQVLSDISAWRSGMLVFRDTPLAEAAAEFNRYNRTKLVVADAAVANLKIDGTFRTDNVEGFVGMAEHVLDLRVHGLGDNMTISR